MEIFIRYFLPIATFSFGVLSAYSAFVRKSYAAQRDFQELMKNYSELLKVNIDTRDLVDRRIDHIERTLIEVKVYLSQRNYRKD